MKLFKRVRKAPRDVADFVACFSSTALAGDAHSSIIDDHPRDTKRRHGPMEMKALYHSQKNVKLQKRILEAIPVFFRVFSLQLFALILLKVCCLDSLNARDYIYILYATELVRQISINSTKVMHTDIV